MTNEELLNKVEEILYGHLVDDGFGYRDDEFRDGVISTIEIVEKEIKERLIKVMEISKESIKNSLSHLNPLIVEEIKDYADGQMDTFDTVLICLGEVNISDEIRKLK